MDRLLFSIQRFASSLVLFVIASVFCKAAESLNNESAKPETSLIQTATQNLGVTRGICVVLGDPTCELALKMARESELLIYAQMPDAADVEKARQKAHEAGFYGTRIYIEKGAYSKLYLADNIADALVAVGEAANMPQAEAKRVLHPGAKALIAGKELIKPSATGTDDWSHPYHGPDNNPLSRDQIARAPYLTQFLSDPRYAPVPQVAVASAGRVFKLFGHIAFKAREEPWLNTLAAFNGYNGVLLWRREIPPALMVHRSTLIATPTVLYFGDDKSCKVIDAATGELRDEIAPPEDVAGGTFWKWMALENGALYALIGEQEERDPVIRARRETHGWPWNPLSPGYNKPDHTWGFGRTLLAIDPATKKILWRHQETEPIDSRALCMKDGRIYAFRFGAYLVCLDAKTGKEIWRKTKDNAHELFAALGQYMNRQGFATNWRTTAYLKCSDKALYFAGPPIGTLLAVSATDGKVLWTHPYNNYQLLICDDGLYGLSGQTDRDPARKFNPLTGEILAEIKIARRACTRVTGSVDAIFCRAGEGSTRIDRASNRPQLVSPMRPQCHDGVTIANGLLYWWPSVCDCNLTLYGITCLGPAGGFDFKQEAIAAERLESFAKSGDAVAGLPESDGDWPSFRANNTASVTSKARIPANAAPCWKIEPSATFTPTAPTAAGGLAFFGGSDGIVRAVDAQTGNQQWTAYTGGRIQYPPTISKGRAYVGSGDGWVYCFEAKTGRLLWRFRAAPVERRIPVYGELQSTWPAASGVLVSEGVAYVAAGILNYDGTHVYALDAATGRIKWQNNSSGQLDSESRSGVSVQGHMMLVDGKLYLAGGNAVSPAVYDIADGRCLNDPGILRQVNNNNVPGSRSPRGSELYEAGGKVQVSGKPLYAHPQYDVYDNQVSKKTLLAATGDRAISWSDNAKLVCSVPGASKPETKWGKDCKGSLALAVAANAVVVAKASEVVAYDLQDGATLWTQPLPASPAPFGLAISSNGGVIVTLEGGKVVCIGISSSALMH
ncbi:MAG: PQQ-binding-like beta-propeller repeat protein [Candidatus Sumerlaeota bacterium]|nr:PQQ-binding-like beta-propeller repeat protein [Candidatus Sumerlaeota bacterium]